MKQATPMSRPLLEALACLLFASCGCAPPLSEADAQVQAYYIALRATSDLPGMTSARATVRDSADIALLHESALWEDCLSAWTMSYPDSDARIEASQALADRVAQQWPELLKPLVHTLCKSLKNGGDTRAATAVAAYPFGIDAAQNGEIAHRLLTATLLPGTKAPALEGLPPSKDAPAATLLFFYESKCRSCQGMVWQLTAKYPALREKGVRVVSLSTDTNEREFAGYSDSFPWPDKLCDLRGFHSPNMTRYGVASTPTLYLIDGLGTVKDWYGAVEEALLELGVENAV